jgi:DNA polymerase III alpha subunit (gram-positive type)
MLLPSKIICFDTETTDVDKHLGSIIQLSAILLDKNFEIVKGEEFNEYIKPIDNHRNTEAMNINKISEETLANAMSLNEVLELFENFCGKGITLSCWPANFDIPFLKCQYEKIGRKWIFGHRFIDLKTIAIWESAKRNNPVKGGIIKHLLSQNKKFEGTQHDALSDIKNAVSIIKNYG